MAERLQYELRVAARTSGERNIAALNKQLGNTTAQANAQGMAANRAAAGNRNMGLATLEASRAFEDMQYGLRGALNNIPSLVMMLGGSGGLAGVISIAAVSLSIFGKQLDEAKRKAKEAGDEAGEMTDKLIALLDSVRTEEIAAFSHELEMMEAAQRRAGQAAKDAVEIEAERRQSLERIADKLREGAALEIDLAAARGQITAREAAEQKSALRGEAEAAKQAAQLALAQDRVNQAEIDYNNQVAAIRNLEETRATLEEQLRVLQRDQQTAGDSVAATRRNLEDDPKNRRLKEDLAKSQEIFDRLQKQVKEKLVELDRLPQQRDQMMQDLARLGAQVDSAIKRRENLGVELDRVREVSFQNAKTAATTAAEEARAAVEERMQEATAAGRQVSEEIRTAFAELNRVLADGVVDDSEVQQIARTIERFTQNRTEADQAINKSFQKLDSATQALLQQATSQAARVNNLETSVRNLQNLIR